VTKAGRVKRGSEARFNRRRLERQRREESLALTQCRFTDCLDEPCDESVEHLCLKHFRRLEKYSLTFQRFRDIFFSQDERCAICLCQLELSDCCIDHDHACCPHTRSCGKCVRGLLCRTCNYGLGSFKDSTTNLYNAIFYLKDHAGLR